MSSQQPGNHAVQQSSPAKVPRVTITSDDNGTKNPAIYVGQIPTTNRPVCRVVSSDGESYRFRPSPNSLRDPFAHATLSPRPAEERCSILYCEYCALCARCEIDAHALQLSLVPEGAASPRWDPYFHWFLNEQIPNLHFGDMGPGSRNWSNCWISHCPCRDSDADTDQTDAAPRQDFLGCPCKRLGSNDRHYQNPCCSAKEPYAGNQDVGCPEPKTFPFQVCPRYRIQRAIQGRHNTRCCVHCFAMQKIQEKGMAHLDVHFSRREQDHNDTLFRRIAYTLSPLTVDPDAASRHAREDYETGFFNLPDWALRGYRKTRFLADDRLPRRGRDGKPWTRVRCPSPYPRVDLGHAHKISLEGFGSASCQDCQGADAAFSGHSRSISPPLTRATTHHVNNCVTRAQPNLGRAQVEVEQLTAEEERFRAWSDDVEGFHQREEPRRLTREPVSFWRKVKIICGVEEDPNCCEHCELDKAACVCLVQQEV